jgi:membrane protease YdiL (CAAX protease family)
MGTYKFSPWILVWALPTTLLSILSAFVAPDRQGSDALLGLTKLQMVVFIWGYASLCEEALTRGLLQTLLGWGGQAVGGTRRGLSMPVVLSALFFGAMHIVLIPSMGAAAAPLIVLTVFLGLVAGRYREKTGSLIPAVIVHALFNVGGMLPRWVLLWVLN